MPKKLHHSSGYLYRTTKIAMYITISEDNRLVLEELKEEVIQIKQEATELSISLLIQWKTLLFQFVLSYKEYSLTNIREYGLGEILMSRAMRFFKLDNGGEEPKKPKEKSKLRFRIKAKNENVQTVVRSQKRASSRTSVKSFVKSKSKVRTQSKKGYKFILKRTLKIILFPFYLIILILGMLLESENNEKSSKNVKNTYKPY